MTTKELVDKLQIVHDSPPDDSPLVRSHVKELIIRAMDKLEEQEAEIERLENILTGLRHDISMNDNGWFKKK